VSSTKAAPSSHLVDDSDELCIFEFDEESQRRSHQKPSPVFNIPSTGRKQNSAHAEQRKPKDSSKYTSLYQFSMINSTAHTLIESLTVKNDIIAQMTMAGCK
jgi:hypothetical protein